MRSTGDDGNGKDALVVPFRDRMVAVFSVVKDLADWVPVHGPVASQVMTLLNSSGERGAVGQRLFAVRDQDLAWIDSGRRFNAEGGYFRGFFHDSDGHFGHQLALREVDAPSQIAAMPIDPMALLAAAQLGAIQAQLGRMETQLLAIRADVDYIIDMTHREQDAQVQAACHVVAEVHSRYARTGRVSEGDWVRIVVVEKDVRLRQSAIIDEFRAFGERFRFTGNVADDRRMLKRGRDLDPSRLSALVGNAWLLAQARARWSEMYFALEAQRGDLDGAHVQKVVAGLEKTNEDLQEALLGIHRTATESKEIHERTLLRRLLTDGQVEGARKDRQNIDNLHKLREAVGLATAPAGLMSDRSLPKLQVRAIGA